MKGTGNGFAAAQPATDPNLSSVQALLPPNQPSEQHQGGQPTSLAPLAASIGKQAAPGDVATSTDHRPARASAHKPGEDDEATESDEEAPAPLPPLVVEQSSAPMEISAPPPPKSGGGGGGSGNNSSRTAKMHALYKVSVGRGVAGQRGGRGGGGREEREGERES